MNHRLVAMALVGLGTIAPGCGATAPESAGRGSFALRISGEGAAKQGYPYEKNGARIAFADGWELRFTKYVVSFGGIQLRASDGETAVDDGETYLADLRQGDPTVFEVSDLPARRFDRFSFRIVAASATARRVGAVADADVERMVREGLNYWVEGNAEKDGRRITFAWGLQNPTRNSNCTNGVDDKDGFVIRPNTRTDGEITVHLDHLFWDSLGTERATLRFDAIAAVADAQGHVPWEALARQSLADLRALDGNPLRDEGAARVVYNPGSIPLEEPTLQAFMLAATASQAHVNGLGLCTVSRL